MNKNIIKLLGAFALVVGFASCEDDDTNFVSNTDKMPVVTVSQNSYTVAEGDALPITLTLDKPNSLPVYVKFDLVNENDVPVQTAANEDEPNPDFTMDAAFSDITNGLGVNGYYVRIPANTTTFTFNFNPTWDDEFEETETLRMRLSSTFNLSGALNPASEFITISIENKAADLLNLSFAFDRSFDFGGSPYTLCEIHYDMDFLVFNDDLSAVVGDAATADCVEQLSLSASELGNGDYHIYLNLWDNVGLSEAGITPAFEIPVTVSYQRNASGTLQTGGTYVQDSANAVTSDTPSDTAGTDLRYVVSVHIEDGIFTLYDDSTGNTIISGRNAAKVKALLQSRGLRKK